MSRRGKRASRSTKTASAKLVPESVHAKFLVWDTNGLPLASIKVGPAGTVIDTHLPEIFADWMDGTESRHRGGPPVKALTEPEEVRERFLESFGPWFHLTEGWVGLN